jgi:hypothetical protein
MATISRRPQSWSALAGNIYPDLNNDEADRARERYAKWQEDSMRPYGFTRTARAEPEHPDWFPRRKGK